MSVPILKQGDDLTASVPAAMTDSDAVRLQEDLTDRVGQYRYRTRGIIIDVAMLDVMDSVAARSRRTAREQAPGA